MSYITVLFSKTCKSPDGAKLHKLYLVMHGR